VPNGRLHIGGCKGRDVLEIGNRNLEVGSIGLSCMGELDMEVSIAEARADSWGSVKVDETGIDA